VTLIAVTKTFPGSDIRELVHLDVRDIGENRDQEASGKAAELADVDVRWHFVGSLQSNKAGSVSSYAFAVHSVDRPRLVAALSSARGRLAGARPPLEVFVQVSLDGDPHRGGAPAAEVSALCDAVAGADSLRLAGVMAVAPLGGDPAAAFDRLATVAAEVREHHPAATGISAGMSGDLEAAVAAGATHLRIGTALLGGRRPPVG
jgi:pyridoxal phosphate enzyme (YggS family)